MPSRRPDLHQAATVEARCSTSMARSPPACGPVCRVMPLVAPTLLWRTMGQVGQIAGPGLIAPIPEPGQLLHKRDHQVSQGQWHRRTL
jgi:hypothetical protein